MISPKSPFPGPVPLTEEDGLFAAERLSSTAELIDRLDADRIVLLYSPSGAGKSSLLNAGLIPAMKHRGIAVRTIRVSTPNRDHPAINRYTWSCIESLGMPVPGSGRLADSLGTPADDELLVFDQFEEILTADPQDDEGRRAFFSQLGDALRIRGRYAVFAVREDYLAPLDEYLMWLPGQLTSRMRIDILTPKGAAEQIRGAVASKEVVTIDERAVGSLVKDLAANGWVEPVQLQVVCARLWNALPEGTTRIRKAYLRLCHKPGTQAQKNGSTGLFVESALEDYYADMVGKAAEESGISERKIRDWFETLILTNSAGRPIRVPAPDDSNSKSTAGLSDTVVKLLEDANLVRSDSRRNVTWRELTHDRLIEPVKRSNSEWFRKNLEPLQRQAAVWAQEGRPPRLLLRGNDLKVAEAWADAHKTTLLPVEKDLIDRSRDQRRETRRFQAVVASFIVMLIGGLSWVTWLLIREHQLLKQTSADEMSVISNRLLRDGDTTRAIRVAEMAYEVDRDHPFSSAEEALINGYVNASLGKAALYHAVLKYEDSVNAAAYAPDGSELVTVSEDGTAALWNRNGVLRKRMNQGAAINNVAFTHDGKRIVTVGEQHLVKMWDADGNLLRDMAGHGCARDFCGVAQVAISPDDQTIVTVGDDENVIIWNHDGALARRLTEHVAQGGWVKTVVFSPDGRYFATGGRDFDRTVQLYRANGDHIAALTNDNCPRAPDHWNCGIFAMAFSPDDKFLLIGSADPAIKMYDLKGNYIRSFTGHTSTVYSVAFSPDGKSFLSASADKTAILRNLDGTVRQTFKHDDYVLTAIFSRDGSTVLTAGRDKTARLWDLNGNLRALYSGHQSYVKSAIFSPDEKHVLTVSTDKTARIWEREPPRIPVLRHDPESDNTGKPGTPQVVSARFLPNGKRVVTATNRIVRLWEIDNPARPLKTYAQVFGPDRKGNQAIRSLDVSPDGRRFITTGSDNHVRIWDVESGKVINEWEQSDACNSEGYCGPTNARYSPDGRFIAVSDNGGTVKIFDGTGNFLERSVHHRIEVNAIAVSPDDKLLATGSNDAAIKLWDFQTGSLLETFKGHRKKVDWVTFSKKGDRILSGSVDRTVKMWDLKGRIVLDISDAHADEIRSVEFSPDMRRIISASQDRTAKIWDLTGRLLRTLSGHGYYLRTAFFSPGKGDSIVTASGDGTAIVWPSADGVDRKIHNDEFYRLTDEDLTRLGIHIH